MFFKIFYRKKQFLRLTNRNTVQSTGRCFNRLTVYGCRTLFGYNYGMNSGALCTSCNCAKISYVGNAIENQKKWRFALCLQRVDNLVEVAINDLIHKCNNALMV